ncbi:hypothetical protein GC738_23655, partial [Salmonella enterica]|nr:hypothetical protein [Salmonella enterica]EDH5794438.1 hypothetical protein [Salmonella enterica subsp. enterica serovar Newport]
MNVTNTLNVNGGLGYGAFEAIRGAGIDNNTAVTVTVNATELADMGFTNTNDWTFNGSEAGTAAAGKNGTWGITYTNITANTNGNISLTGVNLTSSNLTGSTVTLSGAEDAGLTVTGTTLNATTGNVSLKTTNGTLTVGGVNITSASNGTVLSGTSAGNAGVKLTGNISVIRGNLTVNGTANRTGDVNNVRGIDARNAVINVSDAGGVLTMTGKIAGDRGNGSITVVGLDLSGNITVLNATTANLTGVSAKNGYGFLLNASLQGGLTTNSNLTLSSDGSGVNVTNQIGSRVNSTVVKYMVDNNTNIGSMTEVGIDNIYTQSDFTSWIRSGCLTKNFGDFSLKFSGINISAGNINLTGTSFTNSNLTATDGDLVIDNKGGQLGLQNTTLNANEGAVTLTGGKGVLLSSADKVMAKNDITISASHGGVTITGNTTGLLNINSAAGNISVNGNAAGTGSNNNGVFLENTILRAAENINITGVSDGSLYAVGVGGVRLSGAVTLNSKHNNVNGTNIKEELSGVDAIAGVVISHGEFNFYGDTDINADSKLYAGLFFSAQAGFEHIKLNFYNGEFNISAIDRYDGLPLETTMGYAGGISLGPFENTARFVDVQVVNGTLNITAESKQGQGISTLWDNSYDNAEFIDDADYSGFIFTGNGDVNIKGVSEKMTGVQLRSFDNTNLTGKFTLSGESKFRPGILANVASDIKIHNASIYGKSEQDMGIKLDAGSNHSKQINL